MASFFVNTDYGRLFVLDAPNPATAKSLAGNWVNQEFGDDIPDGTDFLKDMTVESGSVGQIKNSDRIWGGYGLIPGKVTPNNFVQIQDNLSAGFPWDYQKPTEPNLGAFDYNTGADPATPPSPVMESRDLVDPVQGFLKGLGFNFDQGASAARDFQQRQGRLGQSTFAAQRAADFFRDNIPGGGPQDSEQFARGLGGQLSSRFGNIGGRALSNLKSLSALGGANTPVGDNEMRQFVNPYSGSYTAEGQGDLQSGNIANLLTAAFQGAGVSPLYANQVRSGQVEDMFTRYANANPNLGSDNVLDQNFLKYASDQLGLSRFFG